MNNPSFTAPRNQKSIPNIWKWILLALILILALFFATRPLRIRSADNYVKAGDNFLAQKKYLSADVEYRKALTLDSKALAVSRRELAVNAQINIKNLEKFYTDRGDSAQTTLFAKAKEVPQNESDAVKESRSLVEAGEYQLAIIPAQTAIEMDKDYRDAWLYDGIANLKTAQSVQLTPENKQIYLNAAKDALSKARSLDPQYQPTLDYLKEIGD